MLWFVLSQTVCLSFYLTQTLFKKHKVRVDVESAILKERKNSEKAQFRYIHFLMTSSENAKVEGFNRYIVSISATAHVLRTKKPPIFRELYLRISKKQVLK